MGLTERILDGADRRDARDAPALEFEGEVLTWRALGAAVGHAAAGMRDHGVAPGSRVALYGGTSLDFVAALLGALAAGATALPLNPAYRTTELDWILGDAAPRLVVADPAGLALARARAPAATRVVDVREVRRAAPASLGDAPRPGSAPAADEERDALLVYTSGTTGRPKGARLTHANIVANARALDEALRRTRSDRFLLALPLFHVHGLCVGLIGALLAGCETLLLRAFDARTVLDTLSARRCSLFMGVPTMYSRLLEAAGAPDASAADLAHVRLFVSGSAPLPPALARRFEERFGARILERYGMTETLITLIQDHDGPRTAGTVGKPVPGMEVRVVDAANRPVEDGTVGELQVRGPSVGPGYLNDAAATRAAFVDGWFKTGDLARRDPRSGDYTLAGRARELIISGGYNVYPREVEDALLAHPAVLEAAVFGRPDPDLGEAVHAAVVLRPGSHATVPELIEHCRARIASFKKPRAIRVLPALPRNAMGKVQKDLLRDDS